ncbi:MAG: O-acetyl-ADP-ribose deacetylase [Pyrinomonadaceae bacterium]|jgi:O-acetyl-ADP-ribose deacetylase (regulator of RNase III)|nr:O-acetyl-ADP-ribose deacetylase [Pyrinomonadaceae bacterium]
MNSFLHGRVSVVVGDITRQATDALVNAANSSLLGGGGVDGAIHRAGGAEILEACRVIRNTLYPEGLPTGEAVITTGGRLAARHVIHTVGPIWGQHAGREAELLAACYRNSLALAVEHGLASIAFPAISTGIYGYPAEEAAQVSSQAIREFLTREEDGAANTEARPKLEEVRLVFLTPPSAEIFLRNHKFE